MRFIFQPQYTLRGATFVPSLDEAICREDETVWSAFVGKVTQRSEETRFRLALKRHELRKSSHGQEPFFPKL
jgi:hypothetical protein